MNLPKVRPGARRSHPHVKVGGGVRREVYGGPELTSVRRRRARALWEQAWWRWLLAAAAVGTVHWW